MNAFLLTGILFGTGALSVLEWCRPDRRRLAWRLAATLTAVTALGWLVARPVGPVLQPSKASLWTSGGYQKADASVGASNRFVLPDAASTAPPDAKTVSNIATLLRWLPRLATLDIFGDGLDPAELPALDGIRVVFHPSTLLTVTAPELCFLSCPRVLPLGGHLEITGRVAGLPAGARLPLSLEIPDGAKIEASAETADAAGEAAFSLRAPSPPATGHYLWKLSVGGKTRPIGVSVISPTLPRVLVLEASPRFDTAALRRWFEGAGGALTVRSQIGKDRFRFAASPGAPLDVGALDAASAWSSFDVVVADGRVLAALTDAERAALLIAIETNGLGLLVRADDATPPPNAKFHGLIPWKMTPLEGVPANEENPVRPRWAGQSAVPEIAVPAAPFGIAPVPGQETLIDDGRGRILVAAGRRGRGFIALTLVNDTTRWQRGNEPGIFAAYWSYLFSRLSAPESSVSGRWTLVDGDAGPVFVDHPLELRWTGSPEHARDNAVVTGGSETEKTPLALAQDARERGIWTGMFWPRHGGWHRVEAGSGGTALDFYVDAASEWPALQAARRRSATALYAAQSAATATAAPSPAVAKRIPNGWRFALLLAAVGYLWIERRFSGRSETLTERP